MAVYKMKTWKKMAVVAAAMVAAVPVCAQEEDANGIESYVDVDFVSHYMWRGQNKGGVSLQPEAYVSWKGLTLKLEGNVGLKSSDGQDLDVMLGFERFGFNIGIIDCWESGLDKNDRYFFYEKKGAHRLEANIGYSWKYGSLQAYTIFWGNDFRISGEQAYSTYVELSVPFGLGGVDWTAAIGITPFESAGYADILEHQGAGGNETHIISHYYYAGQPACVMASVRATKTINLGFAHIPIFAELHTNPYMQKATFLCGLTIAPF